MSGAEPAFNKEAGSGSYGRSRTALRDGTAAGAGAVEDSLPGIPNCGRFILAMYGSNRLFQVAGLAVVIVLVCLLAPVDGARADGPSIGVVKTVIGKVELLRDGAPLAAAVGSEVHLHDRLRTAADGAVGVTLDDGTLISLGPASLFEFSAFEYAPRRGAFSFLGSAFGGTMVYSSGKVGKLAPENTRIRTPLSVIAVRGTRFALRLPEASPEAPGN